MTYLADLLLELFEDADASVLYFHKSDQESEPRCVLVTGERWLKIGALVEEMGRTDLLIGPTTTSRVPDDRA